MSIMGIPPPPLRNDIVEGFFSTSLYGLLTLTRLFEIPFTN